MASPTNYIRNQLGRIATERLPSAAAAYVRPPVKNYTDACEAPPAMWEGAIPLRTRRVFSSAGASSGAGGSSPMMDIVEKTYTHPKELPPTNLSLNEVNGMYCIGNDDLMRFFPEGLGGKVMQTMPPGHPRGFLYRSQSHLLNTYISKLPQWNTRSDNLRLLTGGRPGFIFDGSTGTGKSALMCQAVHFARARNILTIYIPNAQEWTHGEWCWPSTILPGFFDAPDASRSMLQMMCRAHPQLMKAWPLKKTPKDLPCEVGESPPKNLFELAQWGHIASAPASIDRQSVAIKYLMDEIMAEKDKPVLFVVDGMNLFCQDTHYRYPHPDFWKSLQSFKNTDIDMYPQELPRIPSSRLSIVRAMNKIQYDSLSKAPGSGNKFFITCTTRNFKPFDGISGFELAEDDKAHTALDEYAPFHADKDSLLHPMNVENFDDYEYRSFLRFLINSGELAGLGWGPLWHHSSPFERKLEKIDFLSERNPQAVVDHHHGELVWKTEYQRTRQKQYLLNRGMSLLSVYGKRK